MRKKKKQEPVLHEPANPSHSANTWPAPKGLGKERCPRGMSPDRLQGSRVKAVHARPKLLGIGKRRKWGAVLGRLRKSALPSRETKGGGAEGTRSTSQLGPECS